ncbi:MAG TPA: SemiSWEET transporter [Longimicrobium sp.]
MRRQPPHERINPPLEPQTPPSAHARSDAALLEPTSVGFAWFQPGDSSPGGVAAPRPRPRSLRRQASRGRCSGFNRRYHGSPTHSLQPTQPPTSLLPSRRTPCPTHPPHIHPNLEAPIQQFATYIGYVAGALTVISFLPQVVRVWKTKRTNDLSLGMFVILITAGALWITYGVITSDWPVIATNGGMVALNIAILVAKLRFK